jgi:hypothetical protein
MVDIVQIDLSNDEQLDKLAAAVAKRLPPHTCHFPTAERAELRGIAANSIMARHTGKVVAIGFMVTAALGAAAHMFWMWLRQKVEGTP